MSECVRTIKFEHFRGLPANEFKLKGKSLVLLGSNGKGKSALVDGIEFLFSGQVSRFIGVGTGSISHDDAVKNVKTTGDPKVLLTLNPSNGEISRKLSSKALTITDRPAVRNYYEQHPGVDSFVLRRSKILDFVCDQDADRYQKFVQLLGISKVDMLQRNFVIAEHQVDTAANRAKATLETMLAVFNDPVTGFEAKTLDELFAHVVDTVESFELKIIKKWADVEDRLSLLKARRPQSNTEQIDGIIRALVSIETPLALLPEDDIVSANELRLKLEELTDSSSDAPRSKIIEEGKTYLTANSDETHCPLCEVEFEQPLDTLVARLKERSDTLQELRDSTSTRKTVLGRIKRYADEVATQLKKDLEHSKLFDDSTILALRDARASALRFLRLVVRAHSDDFNADLSIPPRLSAMIETRNALVVSLTAQKTVLVPSDSTRLEAAIILLERSIASWEDIEKAEQANTTSREILRRTTIANKAFSTARENAIQQMFTHISGTVLEYYHRLHDFDDTDENSECTALEMRPTSRAAAGGLRLAIQFLGITDMNDPRTFLSEGHLDSLGLCIFLAAVRIFNPPGSLLVLDDVLTSIDKEHRRRVGELLFSEFQDFQIILTTHDEHWYDLLCSTARAWGLQDQWRYIKIEGWTVESGPVLSIVDSSWGFIDEHLTEADYRNLGGPFRFIFEDFLKRTATKIEFKVRFRSDGKYTAGEFVTGGLQDKIRDELVRLDHEHDADISTDIGRVFGQGDLINFLSHDNPGRLEITFDQAKDFVEGLRSLTSRCEEHKLIKAR